MSLERVAKSTKIREYILRAIEEDKYELISHSVYARGFVATYARYLGLDPKDVLLRYQKYLGSLTPSEPLTSKEAISPPKKKVSSRLFFALFFAIALCIALFIYYASYQSSPRLPPSEKKESTPAPLYSVSDPSLSQRKAESQIEQPTVKGEISKLEENEPKVLTAKEAPYLEVIDASMGTAVEKERNRLILKGKSSEFPCDNQRVYFFTRIKAYKKWTITHVWLWKGKEYHQIKIGVRPPIWSVYSYITLRAHHLGEWKAEVRDENKVLAAIEFKAYRPNFHSTQGSKVE